MDETTTLENTSGESEHLIRAEVTEDEIKKQCKALGIQWIEDRIEADPDAVKKISADSAVRLRVVPIRISNGRLFIGMIDPTDIEAADEIGALSGMPITKAGLEGDLFRDLMRTHYGTTAARMAESLAGDNEEEESDLEHNLDTIEADDLHRMAEEPTLINLVNLLLLEAIQSRTSDVHIEPFENTLKVKYRVDGVLVEQPPPPKHLQPALVGRIKIMSGLNIAERYVPQDGKISLRFEGRKVDIRVSTVPTLYGESVVMRILDKSALPLDLKKLGMPDKIRNKMDRLLEKPHGLVLVTGPTGSGKTTTLYASLRKIFSPEKKILTVEDPVEYELDGINQIPVNPKRGLTFATGLRALLRQDPDVILVGEIRDGETADIAIRSAMTGHLILSTLHTNDSIGSIGRLVDMGVEPYLVASVLEGILAQRLGRRICSECKVEVNIPDDLKGRITDEEFQFLEGKMSKGTGCEKCNQTGFKGRIGFYELLIINTTLRRAISENKNAGELKHLAPKDFENMRSSGMLEVKQGTSGISEVLRATQDTEEF